VKKKRSGRRRHTHPAPERRLTGSERVNLQTVMERLVPSVDDQPDAGVNHFVDEVASMASKAPRFKHSLITILDAISLDSNVRASGGLLGLSGESIDKIIRDIESILPNEFVTLLEMVYIAYYSDVDVIHRIGWIDRPLQPEGFELEPFDESVIDKVRQREPFWRIA